MAEGLREVGSCPRCGGELRFAEATAAPIAADPVPEADVETAPHLVLGVPRR